MCKGIRKKETFRYLHSRSMLGTTVSIEDIMANYFC